VPGSARSEAKSRCSEGVIDDALLVAIADDDAIAPLLLCAAAAPALARPRRAKLPDRRMTDVIAMGLSVAIAARR